MASIIIDSAKRQSLPSLGKVVHEKLFYSMIGTWPDIAHGSHFLEGRERRLMCTRQIDGQAIMQASVS
jgi:hypothetical protein